jgi:hypothetical protein
MDALALDHTEEAFRCRVVATMADLLMLLVML